MDKILWSEMWLWLTSILEPVGKLRKRLLRYLATLLSSGMFCSHSGVSNTSPSLLFFKLDPKDELAAGSSTRPEAEITMFRTTPKTRSSEPTKLDMFLFRFWVRTKEASVQNWQPSHTLSTRSFAGDDWCSPRSFLVWYTRPPTTLPYYRKMT